MGCTIIGPETATTPRKVAVVEVDIKRLWSDDWLFDPTLRFMSASLCASAHDLGQCVIHSRYGKIKETYETSLTARESGDLTGWWVRIRFVTKQRQQTVWVGRIEGESRELYGSDTARTGVQDWVAYSPLQLLRKKWFSRSIWLVDAAEKELGWIPSFNRRDEYGRMWGNRSTAKSGDSYVYGGIHLWTRYQMAEYILKRFADESGGPTWTLGGQADLLEDITDEVRLDITQRVSDILARLITPRLGMDYKVIPTDGGFEIFVFALVAQEYSFAGATLPRNTNTVKVQSSKLHEMPVVKIVRSDEQRYGKVRILGARIIVCCSLRADAGPTLEAIWSSALETAYEAGTGTPSDDAEKHDGARTADIYRPVYQRYGAPVDWGMPAPVLDAAGQVIISDTERPYQDIIRRTLPWLPLREGYDYTQDPPVNNNPSGREGDYLPPMVWVKDEDLWLQHVSVETRGIGVYALGYEWGILLSASPNHLLAKRHFAGAAETETDEKYDYDSLVATIALQTDHRLELFYEVPGGDESVMEIAVPDAQLWVLKANTMVGVKPFSIWNLQFSGGNDLVLRNDSSRLALVMAGAIARYCQPRHRAEVTLKGYQTWQDLLGHIMTVVEQDGDTQRLEAPVTSIQWIMSEQGPQTVIRAGYAQ